MNSMYAMQRADGDWFALDDCGRLRMPVFRSSSEAMRAHIRNPGMLHFKPMIFDERAHKELASADKSGVCFWLVDEPSLSLSRGHPLEHAQLALLIHNATEQPQQ